MSIISLRYHEIAIKKGNRIWFEERLAHNARALIERALGLDGPKVRYQRLHGRILIHAPWNAAVERALTRTFGISSFGIIREVPTDLESLTSAAYQEFVEYVEKNGVPRTFRIQTRRSDKALPQTSAEIDRHLGGRIARDYPQMKVDLDHPEYVIGIEIRTGQSHLWTTKSPGPKGMPVGTNGHVLTLLSGGIDSPAAAIQMLRRGTHTSLIHFYGTPFVGVEALHKVEELARIINRFQPHPKPLYVVPFGKLQEKVAMHISPKIRTVIYRRLMLKIATIVARRIRALALVTGESLGQVASQTLDNLTSIHSATSMTILRPFIAMDKDEIIQLAERYETYETSIRPAVDCCTLFADRHPVLHANPTDIAEEEIKIAPYIEEWIEEALAGVQKLKLT